MDHKQTASEVMMWMEIDQDSALTRAKLKAKKTSENMNIVVLKLLYALCSSTIFDTKHAFDFRSS
jgi:hypothetical protein